MNEMKHVVLLCLLVVRFCFIMLYQNLDNYLLSMQRSVLVISATERVKNVETNETIERDPEITAMRPQNWKGSAWLRWDLLSAANAIQWTIMATRSTHKLTLWVSINGLVVPCTFTPTTATRVGIRYPKCFRYGTEEMKLPSLQSHQYVYMERLAKAAIKKGKEML